MTDTTVEGYIHNFKIDGNKLNILLKGKGVLSSIIILKQKKKKQFSI